MYHERTVLSTFALCFLAKILVDASYEGGAWCRGAGRYRGRADQ